MNYAMKSHQLKSTVTDIYDGQILMVERHGGGGGDWERKTKDI